MTARTRFIVVRHGETEWNVANRVQGHRDSPLTAAGRSQAEAIAARLAREHFDALVASDLGRAMDTAAAISRGCGLAVQPEPRVRERAFGEGEGLAYEELERRWPGAFSRDRATDPDLAVPGGESRRQFQERVKTAFEDLAAAHAGRRLVVVAHGGVLAALHRIVHDIPVTTPHRVPIANASYNAVAFQADAWAIEAWGDVDHLPGVVPFVES